jgi:hypothetical protein
VAHLAIQRDQFCSARYPNRAIAASLNPGESVDARVAPALDGRGRFVHADSVENLRCSPLDVFEALAEKLRVAAVQTYVVLCCRTGFETNRAAHDKRDRFGQIVAELPPGACILPQETDGNFLYANQAVIEYGLSPMCSSISSGTVWRMTSCASGIRLGKSGRPSEWNRQRVTRKQGLMNSDRGLNTQASGIVGHPGNSFRYVLPT